MLKVIHSADWHFNDRDHDEIEKCVQFMVDKAVIEQPDLIVIAGDITDSQHLKLDSKSAKTICRQVSELADIAPVVTIIGTPSHDGRSAEILRFVKGKFQIHVSEKPEQIYLQGGNLVDHSGLNDEVPVEAVITQIPTPTKQFFQGDSSIEEGDKAIANAMTAIFAGFGESAKLFPCPHILNGHFQVGGAFISETQTLIGRDIEISRDQLAMAEADVCCLGHIHLHQKIGDNIWYPGSIYRKNFGETEPKGFMIHCIGLESIDEDPVLCIDEESFLDSRFIETPTNQRIVIREDFTKTELAGMITGEDGLERLMLPAMDFEDAFVKVEFKVWQDEAGKINQASLERWFAEAGAAKADISLIRIPRETVRAARVLQLDTLREKVAEMAVLRLEECGEEILEKADMLETMSQEELVQVVGRIN